ncbi:hypothetical protein IF2G_02048 [Cordyceps javanica]|nr:hypothetical protein IF2G_02048 [Cordyceps javanica]
MGAKIRIDRTGTLLFSRGQTQADGIPAHTMLKRRRTHITHRHTGVSSPVALRFPQLESTPRTEASFGATNRNAQ